MRLGGEGGAVTGGINPGGIIALANILVTKVVDSGTATPDHWCFNISPNPNNVSLPLCPASGQSSVQFPSLNTGSYTITETSLNGYHFASGNGTNCTFTNSTATASVIAAAGGATNASCTFHNARNINSPTITTLLSASSGAIGATINDTSALAGQTADAGGTVKYRWYSTPGFLPGRHRRYPRWQQRR